ncbi:hypothetical protein JHK84_042902 [Glycine max]|nr:hypothetical protein JHK84_042902 [Glycine max]
MELVKDSVAKASSPPFVVGIEDLQLRCVVPPTYPSSLDLSQWSTSTILHKAKDIAENNLGSHALTLCVETMLPLCDGGAHNEEKDQENKRGEPSFSYFCWSSEWLKLRDDASSESRYVGCGGENSRVPLITLSSV